LQFFNKLKTKAEDLSFKAQSAMAIGLMTAMAPIESAFADTKIQSNVPTVNSDGSVTLKGGTTGDRKEAVTKFMGEAQFWVGVVATVVGLSIVGYGIWYSKKASKEIQEGNQQGYKSAGNVLMGTAIGGGLMATVGLVLGLGAAFSMKFF
jgi:hypothetical protein